jgi:flagellar biosynthesis GTPase FlhF
VSILFIGFVVSVQPNKAQLLAQKEIKLAEEAALLEQQQIAKAAGFLSVEEYEEAKSVEMPTKALYDAYLSQQAELKLNEEKRKAEQKRLIAEAEEKRKVEEAEKAKLAAKAEEKRKVEEAEKAKLAAIAYNKRRAEEAENARLAEVENARQAMLNHNIANLGILLRCARINGNANQMGEVWWVGMNADGDNSTGFKFPYYNFISIEDNEHEIIANGNSAFLFYYNTRKPNDFAESLQYVAQVEKTESSYLFSRGFSVGSPNYMDDEYKITRSSGILESYNTEYGLRRNYQCTPQSDSDRLRFFTSLYRNVENYTFQKYKSVQAEFDKEKANQKF